MEFSNNNWKNNLQEFCQKNWKNKVFPIYQSVKVGGTAHEPQWSCQVTLQLPNNTILEYQTQQISPNKKEAEKEAAQGLYQKLTNFLAANNNFMNKPIEPNKPGIEKSSPKISYQTFNETHDIISNLEDESISIEEYSENESLAFGTDDKSSRSDDLSSSSNPENGLIFIDLENVPQAKDCIFPSNYQVYFFLSNQHALYDWVLSNTGISKNIHIEIITSSLKNAADHYLSFKAGELSTKLSSKDSHIIIVSRDGAGACTKKCLKMNKFTNVSHITNIRDLTQYFI